ncbi:MAG TPA: preprotein translocase subunit SecG [Acidobacteriota bacterium]
MLYYLVVAIHILVCVVLILVVLLQRGRGADLAVFGGGATQTAFGTRSAATFLTKATAACAIIFMVTSMALAIWRAQGPGASVLEQSPAAPAPAVPESTHPAPTSEPPPAPPAEQPQDQ